MENKKMIKEILENYKNCEISNDFDSVIGKLEDCEKYTKYEMGELIFLLMGIMEENGINPKDILENIFL